MRILMSIFIFRRTSCNIFFREIVFQDAFEEINFSHTSKELRDIFFIVFYR